MMSADQTDMTDVSNVIDITDLSDVIDWDEAMEQCGGDEEFLMELLGDLHEEFKTQIRKIEVAMDPVLLLSIRSAAHVVKGSAANLMCEQLRLAASDLEIVTKNAPPDEPLTEEIWQDLIMKFENLKAAGAYYAKFVNALDN